MKLRFIILINDDQREVKPANISDFGIDYDKPDDRRFSYTAKSKKSIILSGSDFDYIFNFENSGKRCEAVYLDVYNQCNGGEFAFFRRFKTKLSNSNFDLGRCTVEMPLVPVTDYNCFDENKKTEINIIQLVAETHEVGIFRGSVALVEYTSATPQDFWRASAFPEPNPFAKGWVLYGYTKAGSTFTYKYAREELVVPCAEEMDESWIELVACSGGNKTMVRPVVTYNRVNLGTDAGQRPPRQGWSIFPRYYEGFLFTSSIVGSAPDPVYDSIDNGMLLSDIMNAIATFTCGKLFKSNFFQHNADGPFASIYPLFNEKKTANVMVFQKSDVKRPNATDNATVQIITPDKFLNDLCEKFNCGFIIDANYIQVEHISFFDRQVGINTLDPKHSRGAVQSMKYGYTETDLPEKESFTDLEAYNFDFVGVPISYPDNCATKGLEDKTDMELFTTDFEYVLTGGLRDADGNDNGKISEDGFIPVSCELIGGEYFILREAPILDVYQRLNNGFAWAQLHRDYFLHDRPQIAGVMNNVYTTFLTSRPIKKGEPIDIAFCCDDTLKLTDLALTALGSAVIAGASYNFVQDKLTLQPTYYQTIASQICLAVAAFSYLRYDAGKYYFNVAYQDTASHDLILNVVRNGVDLGNFDFASVAAGEFFIDLSAYAGGSYIFKVAVKCAEDFISAWSSSIPVLAVASCDDPLPASTFNFLHFEDIFGRGFYFGISGGASGLLQTVEVEVSRPDGVVFIFDTTGLMNETTMIVRPEQQPYTRGPNHGLYKFRFRYSCTPSQKGPWSTQITVTI